MTTALALPALSLGGPEDRAARMERLVRAYELMTAAAELFWPQEEAHSVSTDAVRWRGAVVSLHEVEDHLYVAWADEDHFEKYAPIAELAWAAAGREGARVIHENADAEGLGPLHRGERPLG